MRHWGRYLFRVLDVVQSEQIIIGQRLTHNRQNYLPPLLEESIIN